MPHGSYRDPTEAQIDTETWEPTLTPSFDLPPNGVRLPRWDLSQWSLL